MNKKNKQMTFFFIVSAGFMQLPEQGNKKAADCP